MEPYFLDYERVSHHKSMIGDSHRTDSYRKAIEKIVEKGDVVAEVGAGTGILSFFAAKKAGKVYAIERTGIIEVAKQIGKSSKMGNVAFIKGESGRIRLPERCDVIVSECLGYFAMQENMVSAVLDFRKRWLKKGGRVIPSSIAMFIAPVSDETAFENVSFWSEAGAKYAIDMGVLSDISSNSTYRHQFNPRSLLSKPKVVNKINMERDSSVRLDKKIDFVMRRNAVLHGFCGFFKAQLAPGVVLDTSPTRRTHWRQEYFPVVEPVPVKKRDRLSISVSASLHKAYVDWNWSLSVNGGKESHSTRAGIQLKER